MKRTFLALSFERMTFGPFQHHDGILRGRDRGEVKLLNLRVCFKQCMFIRILHCLSAIYEKPSSAESRRSIAVQ